MLFSSEEFILIFLPICWLVYFALNRFRLTKMALGWLVFASLIFYGFDEPIYLVVILGSSIFNFIFGANLAKNSGRATVFERKATVYVGIAINLILLGYFKYTDFLIQNFNYLFDASFAQQHIALPLGISFFTFQQIAYLVDSYRGETSEYNFINYLLFVTFFPQLIAGPIVHHKEILPQLTSVRTKAISYANIERGLFIFGIGLFKKLILADTFAIWVTEGFDKEVALDFVSAWVTSLSYTFQLYFDFSGYCDMAIGLGYLFNIKITINFNSPYKATNIQDFWRRWHVTLSRFLRDYLYIPLGGSQGTATRTYVNLFVTFILGGIWHGASWMFVIWGSLHGVAVVIHRIWGDLGLKMPRVFAWIITFIFVNVAWIFFRAKSLTDASRIIDGMTDLSSLFNLQYHDVPTNKLSWGGVFFENYFSWLPVGIQANIVPVFLILGSILILKSPNAFALAQGKLGWGRALQTVLLFIVCIYVTLSSRSVVFLYFNF